MVNIETTRHEELFNPHKFSTPVHVIGAGATGSWVTLMLAKLGIQDITVWDFDHVEAHNIANQGFNLSDVGMLKVDALKANVLAATGTEIKTRNERVENQALYGYVFVLVDSMASRKEIFMNCIKFKPNVKHMFESRMGLSMSYVYNVDGMNMFHGKAYEETLWDDAAVVEVSACGASMSVITSAMHTSAILVRQLININNDTPIHNEIIQDFIGNNLLASKWE